MSDVAGYILAFLGALAAAGSGLYLMQSQKKKLATETDSILVGAAGELIRSLQAEVTRLRLKSDEQDAKIEALEAEQAADRAEVARLRDEVCLLQSENKRLKRRVTELEAENRRLMNGKVTGETQ
jgi:septal ring factor EnvC (AmiA/AmiB activator)